MNTFTRFSNPYRGSMRVDLGRCHTKIGTFQPTGPVLHVGHHGGEAPKLQRNPFEFDEEPLDSARLFVGLSVGTEPRWTSEEVIDTVTEIRTRQTGRADASFILQQGIFESLPDKSVQVVILNVPELNTSYPVFRQQMGELAEGLAQRFEQKLVLGEIQRDGVRISGISATP